MTRAHNRALKPFGLSAVQGQILGTLWDQGAMTIGELQRCLALGSSTLTGALDRMERAELLRRVPVPGDRRAFRLEPAAWPLKRKQAVVEVARSTDEELFRALSAAERRELGRLLAKVLVALAEEPDGDD
jgi:DNA-binding MarR family transcriptional regulator